MRNHDLPSYLGRAQSAIHDVKTLMISDNPNKRITKLHNMCMLHVLHGLHKDFESVCNHIRTNSTIPTLDELMGCLLQIPYLETTSGIGSSTNSESSAFVVGMEAVDVGGEVMVPKATDLQHRDHNVPIVNAWDTPMKSATT